MRGESAEPEPQRVAFVGAAEVKEVRGAVERLAGVDRWEQLQPGFRLLPGDLVRTAEGSAILRMSESKSFVKVTPNTILRLVDMENGWDRGVISGREEQSGFVVRSCRGKAYSVDAEGKTKALQVNEVLAAGSALLTSPGAVVDLFHNTSNQPLRVAGAKHIRLDTPLLARVSSPEPTLAVRR